MNMNLCNYNIVHCTINKACIDALLLFSKTLGKCIAYNKTMKSNEKLVILVFSTFFTPPCLICHILFH
jgi:hypothetical protein